MASSFLKAHRSSLDMKLSLEVLDMVLSSLRKQVKGEGFETFY
jgi:hypothetical protein